MNFTLEEKQRFKNEAISKLYYDRRLRDTIEVAFFNHRIPKQADIQSDCLMVVMENLIKYPLDKFFDSFYNDDKDRLLRFAKSLLLRKCIYTDKRRSKYWSNIAQQIIHASTLDTYQRIDTTNEDLNEDFNVVLIAEDNNPEHEEKMNIEMWDYIRENLNEDENILLSTMLNQNVPKLKGKEKKEFQKLTNKIKTILIQWNINNELI